MEFVSLKDRHWEVIVAQIGKGQKVNKQTNSKTKLIHVIGLTIHRTTPKDLLFNRRLSETIVQKALTVTMTSTSV